MEAALTGRVGAVIGYGALGTGKSFTLLGVFVNFNARVHGARY